MVAQEIAGAQEMGLIPFAKHFALNDFETNRQSAATFAGEQAIREIYLKPFYYTVIEGGTGGIMSSYNRIGCRWAGAYEGLLTNVLRKEWGFNGVVLTDALSNSRYWMDARIGLEAGNDMWLCGAPTVADSLKEWVKNDNKLLANMREACHHYLYAFVNSTAVNGIASGDRIVSVTPIWKTGLYAADAVAGVLAAAEIVLFAIATTQGKKKGNA